MCEPRKMPKVQLQQVRKLIITSWSLSHSSQAPPIGGQPESSPGNHQSSYDLSLATVGQSELVPWQPLNSQSPLPGNHQSSYDLSLATVGQSELVPWQPLDSQSPLPGNHQSSYELSLAMVVVHVSPSRISGTEETTENASQRVMNDGFRTDCRCL